MSNINSQQILNLTEEIESKQKDYICSIVKRCPMLPLQATRLLHLVIYKVIKGDTSEHTYTGSIKELSEFFGVSKNNIYRDIDRLSEELHSQCVYIGSGDAKQRWEMVPWLSKSYYDGKGTLTIKLSAGITPYVECLKKYAGDNYFFSIFHFCSTYSIRIYQLLFADLLTCHTTTLEYDVEEFRRIVCCTNKLKNFSDFRKKVINVAVRDINEHASFDVSVSYKRESRRIKKIVLDVIFPKEEESKKTDKSLVLYCSTESEPEQASH